MIGAFNVTVRPIPESSYLSGVTNYIGEGGDTWGESDVTFMIFSGRGAMVAI